MKTFTLSVLKSVRKVLLMLSVHALLGDAYSGILPILGPVWNAEVVIIRALVARL